MLLCRARAWSTAGRQEKADEPFSTLDVLTAETLRTDLLDLWCEGRMPISSILMVTHGIEEAVTERFRHEPDSDGACVRWAAGGGILCCARTRAFLSASEEQ